MEKGRRKAGRCGDAMRIERAYRPRAVSPNSPRLRSLVIEDPARRAIVGRGGQLQSDLRALFDRSLTPVIVQVGRGVAGIGGVHFDRGIGELFGEGEGHGVQSRLRRDIAERIEGEKRAVVVGLPGERAKTAAHRHDASSAGGAQRRQKGLRDAHGAEHVDVVDRLHPRDIEAARRRTGVQYDAGIVDEDIEAISRRDDDFSRAANAFEIGHVEWNESHVAVIVSQLPDRLAAALNIASPEPNDASLRGELPNDLAADALVGAGDEGEFLVGHRGLLLGWRLTGAWALRAIAQGGSRAYPHDGDDNPVP